MDALGIETLLAIFQLPRHFQIEECGVVFPFWGLYGTGGWDVKIKLWLFFHGFGGCDQQKVTNQKLEQQKWDAYLHFYRADMLSVYLNSSWFSRPQFISPIYIDCGGPPCTVKSYNKYIII